MEEATDKASVSAFAEEVLGEAGWQVSNVRRRSSRLEPPDSYWTMFDVHIRKDGVERRLRLVAKGALNDQAWDRLSDRLTRHGAGRQCDPVSGVGFPRMFPETRHAYWFYPYDASMPGLPDAVDPVRMAGVLLGLQDKTPDVIALSRRLHIERVRYVPEVSAILHYTTDGPGALVNIYGKVQPGNRGLRTYRIVQRLWQAAQQYPDLLKLPRPLGFIGDYGLLLEERVRGKPVGGNRTSTEFMMTGNAAAEGLAVIHESQLRVDETIRIEDELARLDRVIAQLKYVLPNGHFLLKDLVNHMRDRVRKTAEEDVLPTHGDLKYDQFMHHNNELTLLDFDYFAMAETSYDLGKFCAYAVPSSPKNWQESAAAEEVRELFLRRYMELRPQATLQRFTVYEALQFALRAMAFMWAQTSGWEGIAETLLVMGFERLMSRLPE